MTKYLLLIFIIAEIYDVSGLPSHFHKPKDISPVYTNHGIEPAHNSITVARKKKGPSIPYQTYLVQNLHVIPIQHQTQPRHNITQQVIPVLIPIHNYVPVQDLTVIPLHRLREIKSRYGDNKDVNIYRNPMGGYGVGWQYGGQGAGHGFHYTTTYYI